ncbi:type III restriction enzyme, res subunit domain-containing protein [Trichoderma breve]|uniref:Type III restriction enzyme, res subunit domain-containing protein n=1 Tax=Trichoderma breve TaxID=2034170 RepID=A0A9W9B718_9HYPO|nr:type III restriction enzyme, res subunit domain-containing protein [Trichoderma breve]KAJ4857177.1 type III restriction enzyme, res subunit domain-containing protein [Trichoderma breve]
METPKSPQSPPPHTRYPSPPASCPATNEAQPELSGLGGPKRTFQWSADRFSDYGDQDEGAESPSNASPPENAKSADDESVLMKEQTPEANENSVQISENGEAGSQADPAQQGDVVEQNIASILTLAVAEDSDLSDPPGEESDDDSDYVDESDSSPPKDEGDMGQQANSPLEKKEKIKKPRRKHATNAREFVARLHEEEDKKYAKRMQREGSKKAGANYSRKRKLTGDDTDPRKTLKTANGSVLSIVNDGSSTSDGSSLLSMEPIQATTHAQQFAQLTAAQMKSQIPQNCDTRRKNTQNQDLHEAASLFGYKRVEAVNGRWRLKGMETGLDSYQLTAVAWMVKRELARAKPFGGLQADAPGMGKTVMSLACIVGNQADDEHLEKFCNATLVVVPNKTFGKQWEEEAQIIQKHCKAPVKDLVFVYDPQDSYLMAKCERAFIVIATYSDVLANYPSNGILAELEEKYDSDNISFRREFEAHAGAMFKIKWYRIILDEAHAIKNVNSRTSKACCALPGKYRWALTGTPLANSSEEMYPYLKFTECESTWTMKEFKAMYTTKGKSNAQFEALTSLFMYRRTLDDEFLGYKIINLPEKKEVNLDVPLSIEEQVIIEAVRNFYDKAVKNLKQGKLKKDKLEAAVGSLDDVEETESKGKGKKKAKDAQSAAQSASCRLGHASQVRKRQAISHSFCIERLLRRSFELEDLNVLMDALENVQSKQTIIEQIRSNIGEDSDMLRYQTGLEILQQREEPMFGKYFDMTELLKLVSAENALRSSDCLLCHKPPVQPLFADGCGHIFCTKCLSRAAKENHKIDKANFKAGNEDLQSDKKHNCPHKGCGKELETGDDVETVQTKLDSNAKSYREPGEDYNNVIMRQGDDPNGFFVCSTILEDVPTVPSARLTATMAVALTWLHEAPDDKILIFTQFIGTAKILGYMLSTLGIGFVYYWGGLADGPKSKALAAIKENVDVKIMVATLKSGGQCLNLTVANRVIIIDPWWNKTAEQQAFGRVTRMGQLKATHLVTLKTEDETDTRIHNLKMKKAADVDYTLQDDGHTPLDVSEMELQEDILRKKAAMEEKKNKAKARAAKKNATKASSKKKN